MPAFSVATITPDAATITNNVRAALAEDIGSGDLTAALIPATKTVSARIISRESGVMCGRSWVECVFRELDPDAVMDWQANDGDIISADQCLFTIAGKARALLTGERTALNFLQLLSGTATTCRHYAQQVADTAVKLLDTRKTIPGLRLAQKYAVGCGGCYNHRIGLYDAFLIKENHISAAGGIREAITGARALAANIPVEVEVETLTELEQAITAEADRIMLDNFSLEDMARAVAITAKRVELEASGNVSRETLRPIALTGVDYISIGALTKDCRALDLSMRLL
ncbi:MAG: carboxylating nicotinate-nucleotide diphosphorylase [Pseudomonadota bacterium]